MTVYACDVSSGAQIAGPLYMPHPVGIVIGSGTRIGARVQIFQHVTLGRDGSGEYPTIADDVILFAGATVVGGVTIGSGARVGALKLINSDLQARAISGK